MKILLVDDHALIRDALRSVLRELVEGATVLEAPDFRQATQLIEQHPDLHLILLDVAPDRDGFLALAEVRERYPAISIVVLSGQPDRASVIKALDLGALGFIPKSVQPEVMRSALQLMWAGGIFIPPEILTRGGGQGRGRPRRPRARLRASSTRYRRALTPFRTRYAHCSRRRASPTGSVPMFLTFTTVDVYDPKASPRLERCRRPYRVGSR
jgi:DNA-binding NarL/FixJ family response regulator